MPPRLLIASAALLSCILSGCNDTTSTNPLPISGVVATGNPVQGVVVTAVDAYGYTMQSQPTDSMGRFQMTLSGHGPYVLTAPSMDPDGTPIVLSSVVNNNAFNTVNLNPLTALITQRMLGATLNTIPNAGALSSADLSYANLQRITQQVVGSLQPLLSAFSVSATESSNPFTYSYVADPSKDPLDKLFNTTHFFVAQGTVQVGSGISSMTLHIPASGTLDPASSLSTTSIQSAQNAANSPTATPIQHLIVVVGENHTLDNLFATYQPKAGEHINNLLSEGIINADGTPGINYPLAEQNQASALSAYSLDLQRTNLYTALPQPTQIGIVNYQTLQTAAGTPNPNFPTNLPPGPFQITKYVNYGTGLGPFPSGQTGDPVHRFFQMWQQTDGDNSKLDMYTWVAVNAGQGGQTTGITASNPGQGGELMGFFNMSSGDAPYLKSLADQYALSDNDHQGILGGTGMNFFYLASGDVPVFNYKGSQVPPSTQIENPNPQSGTNDFFAGDGYNGGSYVNCSDASQPGVQAILIRLQQLGTKNSRCAPGSYYLVNNYNPAYGITGTAQPIIPGDANYSINSLAYPPQTLPSIGDALTAKGISWSWFTGGTEVADVMPIAQILAQAKGLPASAAPMLVPTVQAGEINLLGDALLGFSSIVTQPSQFNLLKGLTSFYGEVANGSLPAVSFVVPMNTASGHPGYSDPASYEAFLKQLVTAVQSNSSLWANTAIVITTDEGGGSFDSGYIQNLDFFGDGPRIPLLVVSPYARQGHVDHVYQDHASILKFIEHNWRLGPLSSRSRDNFPNPVTTANNPYRPVNGPAIGDLMSMFNF